MYNEPELAGIKDRKESKAPFFLPFVKKSLFDVFRKRYEMQPVIPSQVRTYPKKFYDKVNKVKWPGYDTCSAFVELSDIFSSVRSSRGLNVRLFWFKLV